MASAGVTAAMLLGKQLLPKTPPDAAMNISQALETLFARRPDALYVAASARVTSALRTASSTVPTCTSAGCDGLGAPAALGIAERRRPAPGDRRRRRRRAADGRANRCGRSRERQPTNLLVVVMADGKYSMTGGQPIETPLAVAEAASAIPGISGCRVDGTEGLSAGARRTAAPRRDRGRAQRRHRAAGEPVRRPRSGSGFAFEAEIERGPLDGRYPAAVRCSLAIAGHQRVVRCRPCCPTYISPAWVSSW